MTSAAVLSGVKVVDFSWVAAGPQATRTLAEHGATVVRVESHANPEITRMGSPFRDFKPGINRSAHFTIYNTNKYGISLNLAKPRGKDIARRLMQWADVVVESFTPGTMQRLGLDYEEARKLRPDIIYCSTSMQGQDGPYASFGGLGSHVAALAGFCEVTGYADGEPALANTYYTDYFVYSFMVIAIVGALSHRRKTGQGMHIDQSQYESAASFLTVPVLDYAVNGRVMHRTGNRDPHAAPHGCFPCRGDDRWVAITVFTDQEWKALYQAIAGPKWEEDPRFATVQGRKANEDELEKLVASWTANFGPEELVALLQSSGVPAGIVSTGEDVFKDPQLEHRGHFAYLDHKEIGRHAYHNEAIRFSKSPPLFWKAAPCLGEDNEYVYKDILGFSEDDIADLIAEGVITTEGDLPV